LATHPKSCDVAPLSLDTVEFVYRGHVSAADLHVMVEKYKALRTERGAETYNVVDTLAVTGVDKEIGQILGEVLEMFRQGGGKHVIMAATEDFVRMLGRSMSFSAGVKLHLAPTRAAALEKLRTLKDESGSAR
jgi:hypothetical protein